MATPNKLLPIKYDYFQVIQSFMSKTEGVGGIKVGIEDEKQKRLRREGAQRQEQKIKNRKLCTYIFLILCIFFLLLSTILLQLSALSPLKIYITKVKIYSDMYKRNILLSMSVIQHWQKDTAFLLYLCYLKLYKKIKKSRESHQIW